jgi:hypothetical protein
VRISAKYFRIVEFAGVAGIAPIVGIGAFVSADIVTVGTVAAFVLYLNNPFEPIQPEPAVQHAPQAGAACRSLRASIRPSIAERPCSRPPREGGLELEHVRSATAEDVLHDIAAGPGERLALVGPREPEPTLAKLTARFYDHAKETWSTPTSTCVTQRCGHCGSGCRRAPGGFLFAGACDNIIVGKPGHDAEIRMRSPPPARRTVDASPTLDEVRSVDRSSAGEAARVARPPRSPTPRCSCSTRRRQSRPGTERTVGARPPDGRTGRSVAHRLSTAGRHRRRRRRARPQLGTTS